MAIVTTANSCLTNDINMEKGVSLATMQVTLTNLNITLADKFSLEWKVPMTC